MNARQEIQRIRSLLAAGSVFGLSIAIALGIGAVVGAPGRSNALIALILGLPFVVALATTRFTRIAHLRAGWAVAAVLAGVIGIALATGVGIFYLALAAGFAWAVIAAGRPSNQTAAG